MEETLFQVISELSGTAIIGGIFYLVVRQLIQGHNREREIFNERLKAYMDSCHKKIGK